MDIKTIKELSIELKKLGISRFKNADVEIEFFSESNTIKKVRKAVKPMNYTGETVVEDQLTEEQLLMWSVMTGEE